MKALIAKRPDRPENSEPDRLRLQSFMTASRKKIYLLALALGLAFQAFAKAPAPEQEMADAEAAITAADLREAKVYAPVERGFAEEKLVRARLAIEEKDMKLARRLALEAEVDADLAQARSRLQKARERVEQQLAENKQLRRDLLGEDTP